MKTSNEIFDFLVRNGKYDYNPKSHEEIKKLVEGSETDDGITLWCAVNYVPPFLAPLVTFEEFVDEPYSFRKHFKPLIDVGLISAASEEFGKKKMFDHTHGVVKNYETNISYIQFWLGKKPL